jgi:hypothetical protein
MMTVLIIVLLFGVLGSLSWVLLTGLIGPR